MIKPLQNVNNSDMDEMTNYLIDSFFEYIFNEKPVKSSVLKQLHKKAITLRAFDIVSITMSIMAVLDYKNGARYHQTNNLLSDSKILANSSDSLLAQKINLFASGLIEYYEKNIAVAINYIKSSLCIKIPECDKIDDLISQFKRKAEIENSDIIRNTSSPSFISDEIKDDALFALLQVGRTIAVETNIDSLLTIIARQIQQALGADRCTVFLFDEEHNELWSKVALGLEMQEIRFPVDKGLAGHVLTTGETVNIKNAYESEYFNKEIDSQTGYTTRNILCMPIRNLSHQIIGVFQVLNKIDGDFSQKDEDLLIAIGSSAGIALENANLFSKQKKLIEEQRKLFSSFIDTLSASIDARDKITSGHSRRVMMYSGLICEQLNLSENEKEIIRNAALLHDIGKIGIRDSVLQKEGKLTTEEYEHIKEHARLTHNILGKVYISKNFKDVADIASSHHEKFDGSGYYQGLDHAGIPLGGRILAVCDVFDAITSRRHYRDKMEIRDALKVLIEGKNKHFDPKIVDTFLNISAFDILDVILSDVKTELAKDEHILREFNLSDLYDILNSDESALSKHQLKLIEIFNKHYKNL